MFIFGIFKIMKKLSNKMTQHKEGKRKNRYYRIKPKHEWASFGWKGYFFGCRKCGLQIGGDCPVPTGAECEVSDGSQNGAGSYLTQKCGWGRDII